VTPAATTKKPQRSQISDASSLFLIAVGAILRYAVTVDAVAGIDLDTAGLILMLVGAVGFVLGLFFLTRSPSAGAPGPPPVA
jgi:uncharacterized membrane protein HdeD (DUF308 family)